MLPRCAMPPCAVPRCAHSATHRAGGGQAGAHPDLLELQSLQLLQGCQQALGHLPHQPQSQVQLRQPAHTCRAGGKGLRAVRDEARRQQSRKEPGRYGLLF